MNTLPASFRRFVPNMVYAFGMAAFFFLAVLLYEPQALCNLMHTGEWSGSSLSNVYSFNISIVTAIVFVSTAFLRCLFYLLRDKLNMNLAWYVVWCAAELIITSAFVALYLALMSKGNETFFYFLSQSLGALASILILPYIIITLAFGWHDAAIEDQKTDEGARLKFYDNRHLLKFITTSDSVLYIESNENYVIIHYLDNGIEKKFQLRSSMKSLEPLCEKAAFVRVHRCFFLNPSHVKTIRKDEGGVYYADLDAASDTEIPVSKKFYSNLVALL